MRVQQENHFGITQPLSLNEELACQILDDNSEQRLPIARDSKYDLADFKQAINSPIQGEKIDAMLKLLATIEREGPDVIMEHYPCITGKLIWGLSELGRYYQRITRVNNPGEYTEQNEYIAAAIEYLVGQEITPVDMTDQHQLSMLFHQGTTMVGAQLFHQHEIKNLKDIGSANSYLISCINVNMMPPVEHLQRFVDFIEQHYEQDPHKYISSYVAETYLLSLIIACYNNNIAISYDKSFFCSVILNSIHLKTNRLCVMFMKINNGSFNQQDKVDLLNTCKRNNFYNTPINIALLKIIYNELLAKEMYEFADEVNECFYELGVV